MYTMCKTYGIQTTRDVAWVVGEEDRRSGELHLRFLQPNAWWVFFFFSNFLNSLRSCLHDAGGSWMNVNKKEHFKRISGGFFRPMILPYNPRGLSRWPLPPPLIHLDRSAFEQLCHFVVKVHEQQEKKQKTKKQIKAGSDIQYSRWSESSRYCSSVAPLPPRPAWRGRVVPRWAWTRLRSFVACPIWKKIIKQLCRNKNIHTNTSFTEKSFFFT